MRQRSDVHHQPVKRQRRNAIRPNSDEARAIEEVAAAYRNDESIVDIRNHVDDISINAPVPVPLSVFTRIVEHDESKEEASHPSDNTPTTVCSRSDEKCDSSDDETESRRDLQDVERKESKECDASDDTSE